MQRRLKPFALEGSRQVLGVGFHRKCPSYDEEFDLLDRRFRNRLHRFGGDRHWRRLGDGDHDPKATGLGHAGLHIKFQQPFPSGAFHKFSQPLCRRRGFLHLQDGMCRGRVRRGHRNRVPQRIGPQHGVRSGGVREQPRAAQSERDGHGRGGTRQLGAPRHRSLVALGQRHHLRLRLGFFDGDRSRWRRDRHGLERGQRDAGVAKRAEHTLELRVRHKAQLRVVLLIEASKAWQFGGGALVQLGLQGVDQGVHRAERFGVRHAVFGHQLACHKAVVGGQPRVEEHVTRGWDDLLLGFVVPRRTRVAHKATQPRKHDAIVVPKHARQRLKHVGRSQRGSVTK